MNKKLKKLRDEHLRARELFKTGKIETFINNPMSTKTEKYIKERSTLLNFFSTSTNSKIKNKNSMQTFINSTQNLLMKKTASRKSILDKIQNYIKECLTPTDTFSKTTNSKYKNKNGTQSYIKECQILPMQKSASTDEHLKKLENFLNDTKDHKYSEILKTKRYIDLNKDELRAYNRACWRKAQTPIKKRQYVLSQLPPEQVLKTIGYYSQNFHSKNFDDIKKYNLKIQKKKFNKKDKK